MDWWRLQRCIWLKGLQAIWRIHHWYGRNSCSALWRKNWNGSERRTLSSRVYGMYHSLISCSNKSGGISKHRIKALLFLVLILHQPSDIINCRISLSYLFYVCSRYFSPSIRFINLASSFPCWLFFLFKYWINFAILFRALAVLWISWTWLNTDDWVDFMTNYYTVYTELS